MNETMMEFRKKFQIDDLSIWENGTWVWSVRPGQCTLGAGVLSMKSYAERFSDLTAQGGEDLASIIKVIEGALSAAFKYDKINYLMLMMVDPPVHFHVVPRYSREIEFAGQKWIDAGWPKLPALEGGAVPEETLKAIKSEILSHLP